jgi:hypothetical protein
MPPEGREIMSIEDESERCDDDDVVHQQQQHNIVMRRVISESEISVKSDSTSTSREYRVRKSSLIGYVVMYSFAICAVPPCLCVGTIVFLIVTILFFISMLFWNAYTNFLLHLLTI